MGANTRRSQAGRLQSQGSNSALAGIMSSLTSLSSPRQTAHPWHAPTPALLRVGEASEAPVGSTTTPSAAQGWEALASLHQLGHLPPLRSASQPDDLSEGGAGEEEGGQARRGGGGPVRALTAPLRWLFRR